MISFCIRFSPTGIHIVVSNTPVYRKYILDGHIILREKWQRRTQVDGKKIDAVTAMPSVLFGGF